MGGPSRVLRKHFGDAEVAQKDLARAIEENVRRLHVAMHIALAVNIVQSLRNPRQPTREVLKRFRLPGLFPKLIQVAAGKVLQHGEGPTVLLPHVEHAHDKGMLKLHERPVLGGKTLEECRILEGGLLGNLDDHRSFQFQIFRAEDHRHPALAQLFADEKPPPIQGLADPSCRERRHKTTLSVSEKERGD
jgi:hypothetical protein